MKHLIILCALLIVGFSYGQQNETELAKQTILTFFDGFHKQDSAIIKSVARDDMTLRSISKDKSGSATLSESTTLNAFMASILGISKTVTFEEKILGYEVLVDGNLANVWTPYEFYFNGNFNHCGVNNFTLYKNNGKWEIIAIVDTRRQEGCK